MLFRKKRRVRPMTEKEKANALNHIEAAIACGGGKMTDACRQDAADVLDGRMSADQVVERIKKKYGFSS